MARVSPAPARVRVSKVDLDAVDCLCLVLLLGLEDELLEDGVVAGDDGDGEDLAGAAVGVGLAGAADAQPVPAVVNCMSSILCECIRKMTSFQRAL